MAIQYWNDLSILVGAREMAGNAKNCVLGTTVQPLDTTPLSTTGWTTLIGGNKSGTVSMDFMADFAAAGQDELLYPYLGVTDVATSFITASADGSTAYLARTLPLSYTPIEGEPGALAMGRLTGQSSTGPVVRGTLMHPPATARTSSSTGTARQLGAVSATQRMYAALHVLSVAGTSTPTLTVSLHSDNAVGFPTTTSRIAFSAATTVGHQFSSAAGAITDDWWRVSWTISGTNPSFLFALTCGIV